MENNHDQLYADIKRTNAKQQKDIKWLKKEVIRLASKTTIHEDDIKNLAKKLDEIREQQQKDKQDIIKEIKDLSQMSQENKTTLANIFKGFSILASVVVIISNIPAISRAIELLNSTGGK